MQFEILATGLGFTEGPVIRPTGDVIVTSLDTGHLYSISAGEARLFAVTGGNPNGATEGRDGSIYVAQSPRLRRGTVTGGIQVVDREPPPAAGLPFALGACAQFISTDPVTPNDLCFGPDGYLWVTDPTRDARRVDSRIWRIDVDTWEADLVCSLPYYANGIAFGIDDDAVYIISTGERRILRYPVDSGRLGSSEVFAHLDRGVPDGCAFDSERRLVVGVGAAAGEQGTLQVFDENGEILERIVPCPGTAFTNVAISPDCRLIVTHADGGAVLEARWPCSGLALHPFRNQPG